MIEPKAYKRHRSHANYYRRNYTMATTYRNYKRRRHISSNLADGADADDADDADSDADAADTNADDFHADADDAYVY